MGASRGATPTRSSTSIPDAYKDIDVVMADAKDLVEVRHTLRQIVNVKGD
jgi:RNA-splicing ligase RtcB